MHIIIINNDDTEYYNNFNNQELQTNNYSTPNSTILQENLFKSASDNPHVPSTISFEKLNPSFYNLSNGHFEITPEGQKIIDYFKNSVKKKNKVLEYAKNDLVNMGYSFDSVKEFMLVLRNNNQITVKDGKSCFIFSFLNK